MRISVSASPTASRAVEIRLGEGGPVFLVTFVASKTSTDKHLDLAVLNQQGLNGTQGIIGQFVGAPAAVAAKDDATSILTVSGRTVEVVQRRTPQVIGAAAECYKYLDLQADGLLDGDVHEYNVESGIYGVPLQHNLFPTSAATSAGPEVDRYIRATISSENNYESQVSAEMTAALAKLGAGATGGTNLTLVNLRNSLIEEASRKLGFEVSELQALSSDSIIRKISALA
jgi:hypothetical protein